MLGRIKKGGHAIFADGMDTLRIAGNIAIEYLEGGVGI